MTSNKKTNLYWILWGLLICLAASAVFTCFYGTFRDRANAGQENRFEETENLAWLYQSVWLLYHDLHNVQNGTWIDCKDLYLRPDEGYELLLDREGLAALMDAESGTEGENQNEIPTDRDLIEKIQNEILQMENYFDRLQSSFVDLNNIYDYCISDRDTGEYVTNMSEEKVKRVLEGDYTGYLFLVTFCFDNAGNVSLGEIRSQNEDKVRKNANAVIWDTKLSTMLTANTPAFSKFGSVDYPKGCTVIFGNSGESLSYPEHFYVEPQSNGGYVTYTGICYEGDGYVAMVYRDAGVSGALVLALSMVALLGLILPLPVKARPWNDSKVFGLPFEILFAVGVCTIAVLSEPGVTHVASAASGLLAEGLRERFDISTQAAKLLGSVYNLAVLTCIFLPGWYLGVCARAIPAKGLRRYIKERSLIYRFFPYIKRKVLGAYHKLEHLDLTRHAHEAIIKIVVLNAIILFVISSLWIGGFMVTLIYSLLLYLILRKYISDLQKKYGILLKATNEMAAGNLNVSIREDIGVFEPFKPELVKIQEGFRRAVDEEVRSQKLKTDLITNVSHDLKTPLTAIITYVNLLKEENLTEEQRCEYLNVLERKSLRLKVLIEDLFEVSKANSQNITLNMTEVDIMSLVKQVAFEMADKLEEAQLDLRMNLTDGRVTVRLDSQKTYRIYENLFGNIAKYAMRGTRVYVNGFRIDDTVVITLKNISAQELTVDSQDLTERFVRGDAARNTEGSGLGLAIAKSFTELQGGTLTLELDGDLFKVTTTWKV